MLFLKDNVRLKLYFKKYIVSKHLINAYDVSDIVNLWNINGKRQVVFDLKEITVY